MGSDDTLGLEPVDFTEAKLSGSMFCRTANILMESDGVDEPEFIPVQLITFGIIFNQFGSDFFHFSAIFFCGNQFSVQYFDAGVDIQDTAACPADTWQVSRAVT